MRSEGSGPHADPPRPIPPFLAPIKAPLGPGDLCLIATAAELRALTEAAHSLGLDPSLLRIVHRDGSPWIEATVIQLDREARAWTDQIGALAIHEPIEIALWRYTLVVYRIGADGAVQDEPFWTPEPKGSDEHER